MDIATITAAATDLEHCADYGNYATEVLCANWTPMVTAIAEPVTRACGLIADVASTDVEAFLARFYQSQRG